MKWVWEVRYYWGSARSSEADAAYARASIWVEAATPTRAVSLAMRTLKQMRRREGFRVPAQIIKVRRMGNVDAR